MADELNILEIKDQIATITFNRPPANAWNLAAMEDFEKKLDAVEADKMQGWLFSQELATNAFPPVLMSRTLPIQLRQAL